MNKITDTPSDCASLTNTSNGGAFPATPRTTLRRLASRGSHDRAAIHAILDEALVCHVAFARDGQPFVVPMAFARDGDALYLHGSTGNRTLRALAAGAEVCVTVTLLDGLVLARSAFHHSFNYRSVVIYATATQVTDGAERASALRALIEHVAPGRWNDIRQPSREEILQTLILRLPITEASAKSRSGPPNDDDADCALPTWAGEVPLALTASAAVTDSRVPADVHAPPYAAGYSRRPRPQTQPSKASSGQAAAPTSDSAM